MSNKTPKAIAKKTKWALSLAVVAAAIVVGVLFTQKQGNETSVIADNCLQTSQGCYVLEHANTNQKRIKGLSDRDSLATQTGMLFTFDAPTDQCIWMKDMRFDLDIIWLDNNKNVTKVMENVSPATYPTSFCSPDTKYVIELNAGDAQKTQITTGKQLSFMLQ